MKFKLGRGRTVSIELEEDLEFGNATRAPQLLDPSNPSNSEKRRLNNKNRYEFYEASP